MNLTRTFLASSIAFAGVTLLSVAQAQDVGQHPAVFAPRALPAVDPSTFIVGHPAGLALRSGHANHEHPAVTRKALLPMLDTGRYLVQPPATTSWSAGSEGQAATLAQVPVIVR
ncbi:MAG: hypothetical protein H0W40_14940 [Methylibium sp.]|uniref:hypothetical protein n=1 Tax=Methylibium sp. TaxID=2067992 RepID=UPI0017F8C604|nr:hypothetical protein [Methylibium sp.]MBA3598653.1 hypothetical protein [Methylibium sp.]